MKHKKTTILIPFFLISCATLFSGKKTELEEPDRLQLYSACYSFGLSAEICRCIEKEAVTETGVTRVVSKEDEDKLVRAIELAFPKCVK